MRATFVSTVVYSHWIVCDYVLIKVFRHNHLNTWHIISYYYQNTNKITNIILYACIILLNRNKRKKLQPIASKPMNYFLFCASIHVDRKLIASDLRRNGRQQHQFTYVYGSMYTHKWLQISV